MEIHYCIIIIWLRCLKSLSTSWQYHIPKLYQSHEERVFVNNITYLKKPKWPIFVKTLVEANHSAALTREESGLTTRPSILYLSAPTPISSSTSPSTPPTTTPTITHSDKSTFRVIFEVGNEEKGTSVCSPWHWFVDIRLLGRLLSASASTSEIRGRKILQEMLAAFRKGFIIHAIRELRDYYQIFSVCGWI